jgi:protease I
MASELNGVRVAFLATDGVEQIELTAPWKAVQDAGGIPELVSTNERTVQGFNHLDKGDTFDVDREVGSVQASDYDALVLPGGVANPDALRLEPEAVRLVRDFFETGKPIAAICHAPWLLLEAGVVGGRTVTSFPSLRTDLTNAGATWVDSEVVTDDGLVTSRRPDDLPAFCSTLLREFAATGATAG